MVLECVFIIISLTKCYLEDKTWIWIKSQLFLWSPSSMQLIKEIALKFLFVFKESKTGDHGWIWVWYAGKTWGIAVGNHGVASTALLLKNCPDDAAWGMAGEPEDGCALWATRFRRLSLLLLGEKRLNRSPLLSLSIDALMRHAFPQKLFLKENYLVCCGEKNKCS